MDLRALQRTVSRGLAELGIEDDFTSAVSKQKGWSGTLRANRIRVWQSLADNTDRNFDASWLLIAIRFFAYHDRGDLCDEITGAVMKSRWEGERLRDDEPIRTPRTVSYGTDRRQTG